MQRDKEFINQIGFMKFNSSKGWKALRGCITNVSTQKKYLYPKLDQYELADLLRDLPDEQLNKINENDLLYPWCLRYEKKSRKIN